jgi:hypothetical protein
MAVTSEALAELRDAAALQIVEQGMYLPNERRSMVVLDGILDIDQYTTHGAIFIAQEVQGAVSQRPHQGDGWTEAWGATCTEFGLIASSVNTALAHKGQDSRRIRQQVNRTEPLPTKEEFGRVYDSKLAELAAQEPREQAVARIERSSLHVAELALQVFTLTEATQIRLHRLAVEIQARKS